MPSKKRNHKGRLQVNEFSQDTDTPNTEQAVDQQMQTGREQNIEETEFNDSTAAKPADIVLSLNQNSTTQRTSNSIPK